MDERLESNLREAERPAEAWVPAHFEGREFGREDAHAALLRVLPNLERYARGLVPTRRRRRPPATREDLVQFAALVALTRLEVAFDSGATPPEWWRDDGRLRAYMRGVMHRRLRRLVRDAPRERGDLPEHVAAATALEFHDDHDPLGCLTGLRSEDLRLLARYSQGLSYEELAAEFGASAAALAKRRARALIALRARCQRCPLRRESGCPLEQAGWIPAS